MSELIIGSFLGVIGGFASQRLYDFLKDRENRKKLKENLMNELKNAQTLLTGQGNLLPMITWNSAVTSGDIKLLSFDDRNRLSAVYFQIDNHNYEAKRVRYGSHSQDRG